MDRYGRNGSHAFSTSLFSQHVKTFLSQCLLLVGSLSKDTRVGPTPQRKQHCDSNIIRHNADVMMPMAAIH